MTAHSMTLRSLQRRYGTLLVLRWLPIGFIAPLLVLIFLQRDLGLAQVGPVIAAYSLVTLLAELPTGGLADAYGRRRLLIMASVLQTGFLLMLLVFDGVLWMTLASMLGGASRALDSGPLEAWFVDEVRRADPAADIEARLARGNAVDAIALAVGAVAGGLIGSVRGGDLNAVLIAALVAQLAHIIAAATLMTETPSARERTSGPMEVMSDANALVRSSPTLQRVLAAGVGLGIVLSSIEILFQPRFAELLDGDDATPAILGLVLAVSFVAAGAGAEVGPRLRRRLKLPAAQFLVGLAVLEGVCLLFLAAVPSALMTAVGMVAVYAVLGMAGPVVSNLLHSHVPEEARTTMVSARSLTMQSGGFLGSLTLPALASVWSIQGAWSVAAILVVLAGLPYLGVVERVPTTV